MKKKIKINFTNGINYSVGTKEILNALVDDYDFLESSSPDYILFGPYGNKIPPKGEYIRIGYFCENMVPNLSICEWAFGIPYEEEINHPRYMRINWHGFDPKGLIKKAKNTNFASYKEKKFCNFIYSNHVSYREEFCQKLSKYKPIDCPGKSLNNMQSIDLTMPDISTWERKRIFLSEYKFTIAFENYSYAGYNTEKLLDPMMVDSLPIYLGNPYINRHFNPKSFINAHDYIGKSSPLVDLLESSCRPDWKDNCPSEYTSLGYKIKRKLKSIGRSWKMKLKYNSLDDLIDKIIEIDRNDDLYAKYLAEPWFYNNTAPTQDAVVQRWKEIFGE